MIPLNVGRALCLQNGWSRHFPYESIGFQSLSLLCVFSITLLRSYGVQPGVSPEILQDLTLPRPRRYDTETCARQSQVGKTCRSAFSPRFATMLPGMSETKNPFLPLPAQRQTPTGVEK